MSARDLSAERSESMSVPDHPGPYLDALVFAAGVAVRIRHRRSLFCGFMLEHFCRGDRLIGRSAHAGRFLSAPPEPGVQFRRPFARQARPGSQRIRQRAQLRRFFAAWRRHFPEPSNSFPKRASITWTATVIALVPQIAEEAGKTSDRGPVRAKPLTR